MANKAEKTQMVIDVALTRNFKETVVARVERDPAFPKALLVRYYFQSRLGAQSCKPRRLASSDRFTSPTRAHPRG